MSTVTSSCVGSHGSGSRQAAEASAQCMWRKHNRGIPHAPTPGLPHRSPPPPPAPDPSSRRLVYSCVKQGPVCRRLRPHSPSACADAVYPHRSMELLLVVQVYRFLLMWPQTPLVAKFQPPTSRCAEFHSRGSLFGGTLDFTNDIGDRVPKPLCLNPRVPTQKGPVHSDELVQEFQS